MSERMTACRPRQVGTGASGVACYGKPTREEAIAQWRAYYRRVLAEATAAMALTDEELIVETYVGPLAMRNLREVL